MKQNPAERKKTWQNGKKTEKNLKTRAGGSELKKEGRKSEK
jgi:hypothetical protein